MRVLHVSSGNLYGGVETVLLSLARFRHFCPDIQPHFALSFEGRLSRELIAAGVPIHHLGNVRASRPWTVWRARRALKALLARERFDVMICHMPWPLAIFGPAAGKSLPLVFWMHDAAGGRHWVERWARYTRPALVICNSLFTASALHKLYSGVPARSFYCPVSQVGEDRSDAGRAQIRHDLNTSEDAVVILQVSRMEPLKGHLLHLQALSRLKDLTGWNCWIVGGAQRPQEEQYLSALQRAASEVGISDKIRFLGERSDVPRLLAAADVFCHPNLAPDSFGIVFIEALSASLPVITTAMGGAKEIVDESCGFLVPPNDPPALADRLNHLIQSQELRKRLGSNGPSRARRLCDPATQLKKLRDILQATIHECTEDDSTKHAAQQHQPCTTNE